MYLKEYFKSELKVRTKWHTAGMCAHGGGLVSRKMTTTTTTLKMKCWGLSGVFVQLHAALLYFRFLFGHQVAVLWVAQTDTQWRNWGREERRLARVWKRNRYSEYWWNIPSLSALQEEADAGQVEESGLEVKVVVSECMLWKENWAQRHQASWPARGCSCTGTGLRSLAAAVTGTAMVGGGRGWVGVCGGEWVVWMWEPNVRVRKKWRQVPSLTTSSVSTAWLTISSSFMAHPSACVSQDLILETHHIHAAHDLSVR